MKNIRLRLLDIFGAILNFICTGPLGLVVSFFDIQFDKRFNWSSRVKSEDQFPYTEPVEGFSDSGSTVLLISGAKPQDAAIFVYADFYPHHGKKTFLPQTRLFTALNREESYELQIPWQLFQDTKLWSVSRLDVQIGNDTLFGGVLRTPAVLRLASKCLEFRLEPVSEPAAHPQTVNALGRVFLSCKEREKKGRPSLISTYLGKERPIIRLDRNETEKSAQIGLDITIQGHTSLGTASKAKKSP